MLKKLIAAVFAFSLPATSLFAADLYLGAGLGGDGEAGSFRYHLERFSDASGDSWKLFAGWQVHRHLALEVSRHDFGIQRCCSGPVADVGFTSQVDGFTAAALGRWPVRRFKPFVKAGVLAWEEDGETITIAGPRQRSDNGTDLLVGAGLDVDLPARFALRVDWERYQFDSASSDGLWASFLYRIGARKE